LSERDLYVAERESQPLVVRVASTGTAQVQSMHYYPFGSSSVQGF